MEKEEREGKKNDYNREIEISKKEKEREKYEDTETHRGAKDCLGS